MGLRTVRTSVAGTLSLGEPLAAALLSTTLLGERLTPAEWAACLTILAGLLITSRSPSPDAPSLALAIGMVPMPVRVPLRPDLVGRPHPAGRGVARPTAPEAPTAAYHRVDLRVARQWHPTRRDPSEVRRP